MLQLEEAQTTQLNGGLWLPLSVVMDFLAAYQEETGKKRKALSPSRWAKGLQWNMNAPFVKWIGGVTLYIFATTKRLQPWPGGFWLVACSWSDTWSLQHLKSAKPRRRLSQSPHLGFNGVRSTNCFFGLFSAHTARLRVQLQKSLCPC